ncbi:ATPase domain-containing protein [Desulfopila sp. IMCC35008]|uniref:ATPase domain-containing protein n=1 Tax=Desulfopila sp. IMCC35008 TaxID=2653858 RepID=UPI0013D75BFF|nr:ATPase domain-containing protein [Desulfopila sp. IMCC35008]
MSKTQSNTPDKTQQYHKSSQESVKVLERLETGITGLDEVLGGGLAKGRTMLVTGTTGTGKTVLLNEFLYRGITKYNQNGIYITFEERPDDIIRNTSGFGWNYVELINSGQLAIIDCSPKFVQTGQSGDFDWEVLLQRVAHFIEKIGAERVAVDSIGTVFGRYSHLVGEYKVRELLFALMDQFKKLGVTTLISAERTIEHGVHGGNSIEEFVSDGAIRLGTHHGQNKIIRTVSVLKMRGLGYRSGLVEYDIDACGLSIYPKIPLDSNTAITDFNIRESTGITNLDEAMSGGVPQGHMMLIAGNTGTGKTLLGMHFLVQGIKEGQKCLWIALEEPVAQLKKTAKAHDWDLELFEQEGKLHFIRSELIDISTDKLLRQIVATVKAQAIERVVIDSVSSLESSTMDSNKIREFLIQVSTFFKTRGISCYMNYLSADSFGAGEGQFFGSLATNEMRLSSIVDGIVLLRYVERDQRIMKLMNIFKLRGSDHIRDIFRYEIMQGGIKLGKRFAKTKG